METGSLPEAVDVDVLLRQSQADREEAGRLLDDLRIVEQWQQYGDVEVAGSYRWDLMLRRESSERSGWAGADVDLYVVNPALDLDFALDAFNRFVRRGEFLRFGFIDTVRGMPAWANPKTYPRGYYLGMAQEFHDREWKVEAWLLHSPAPRPDWIEERMTDEGRRTILQLKHQRNARQFAASSYDIYRAVLLGSATSAAQVQEWLRVEHAAVP